MARVKQNSGSVDGHDQEAKEVIDERERRKRLRFKESRKKIANVPTQERIAKFKLRNAKHEKKGDAQEGPYSKKTLSQTIMP